VHRGVCGEKSPGGLDSCRASPSRAPSAASSPTFSCRGSASRHWTSAIPLIGASWHLLRPCVTPQKRDALVGLDARDPVGRGRLDFFRGQTQNWLTGRADFPRSCVWRRQGAASRKLGGISAMNANLHERASVDRSQSIAQCDKKPCNQESRPAFDLPTEQLQRLPLQESQPRLPALRTQVVPFNYGQTLGCYHIVSCNMAGIHSRGTDLR
jgi:hypothetical protein